VDVLQRVPAAAAGCVWCSRPRPAPALIGRGAMSTPGTKSTKRTVDLGPHAGGQGLTRTLSETTGRLAKAHATQPGGCPEPERRNDGEGVDLSRSCTAGATSQDMDMSDLWHGERSSVAWTADALTALVLYGYLRQDFSRMADTQNKVTWRDAVRLRLVSSGTRAVVDAVQATFWRAQYELLTHGKLYDPPHIVAHAERGAYRAAFTHGMKEPLRTNILAPELRRLGFFSKIMASTDTEAYRAARCPWWRYDQPRQHRLSPTGTLVALTHDPSEPGRRIRSEVGQWTYAYVPAAPNDFFICIMPRGTNFHTLWRIQRHEQSWCILIVGVGAFKVSCKIPLRGSEECAQDEVLVDESALMSDEDREMLLAASVAMRRAATGGRIARDAPTVLGGSDQVAD
jgi:hypothetical protein